MKKDLWLVMVFLTALLLGACAMNIPVSSPGTAVSIDSKVSHPASETTLPEAAEELTEQEKAIAQCRTVLDAVQSGVHYKMTLTRWYEGVWDQTQQITYYRSGDNRAVNAKSSGDDHDGEYLSWANSSAKVSFDGKVYYGYAEKGEVLVWEGPLSGEILDFDPWMYTFDWDAQSVELQEIRETEAGRCISFKVDGTYPNDRVLSEYYTITFRFDEDGNFMERELVATGVEQTFVISEGELIASGEAVEGSPIITRVDHVTIDTLDPNICAKEIDALYQEALAYLNVHK